MEQEEKVLKMLADTWNEFVKLDNQHTDEQRDFCDGIHKCQYIIGMRFARKYREDIFPIKDGSKNAQNNKTAIKDYPSYLDCPKKFDQATFDREATNPNNGHSDREMYGNDN